MQTAQTKEIKSDYKKIALILKVIKVSNMPKKQLIQISGYDIATHFRCTQRTSARA